MPLPHTPPELIASQLNWAQANINNNLDFIPDDKLNWKPAPEAKSIIEIINHATGTVNMFTSLLQGTKTELSPVTDCETAKAQVTNVIQAHQSAVAALPPSEGEQLVSTPLGDLPKGLIAALPVVELINHHGQITYIQTLLGDPESHLIIK